MMHWILALLIFGHANAGPVNQHSLDGKINNLLKLPTEELKHFDWESLFDHPQETRAYVDQKYIQRAHQQTPRSKRVSARKRSRKQHKLFHGAGRRLEGEDELHDTCATAKLVQPDGPGSSLTLTSESNENLRVISRPLMCSLYDLDYPILFYKLKGTGNPFYISTCNGDDSDNQLDPILNVATVGDCNLISSMSCIAEAHATSSSCPNGNNGLSVTFQTDNQTEYLFSVRGYFGSAGEFTLEVGELDPSVASSNARCESATEITAPTAGETTNVIGNTEGAWSESPVYEQVCGAVYGTKPSSGLWYSMDSPGLARINVSPCSPNTTVTTFVAVMLENEKGPTDDAQCSNNTLQCLFTDGDSFDCYASHFYSRPDERYRIYVASYGSDFGDIELDISVEEADPFDVCFDEAGRRQSKEGMVCDCIYGDKVELICRDSCLYCPPSSSLCYNRTDTVSLGTEPSFQLQGYTVDVFQNNEKLNQTMVYEELDGGGCNFYVNGSSCFTCQKQGCGAPLVNCTGDEMWDFCEFDSVFLVERPIQGESCESYVSDAMCQKDAEEIAMSEALNCTCETDQGAYSPTIMTCKSECGFFCDEGRTACGDIELEYSYDRSGKLESSQREFQPANVEEQSIALFQSDSFCALDNCHCHNTNCEDGSRRPLADCSGIEGGGIFNFCDNKTKIGPGPYQFLSPSWFDECVDLSPTNSQCENAIELKINATMEVNGSNVYVGDGVDGCNEFSEKGLYYRVIGNGERLIVSTCSDNSTMSTELSVRIGCELCIEDFFSFYCGDSEMQSVIEWDSEDGQEYTVYVGGFMGDRGTFTLQLNTTAVTARESCNDRLRSIDTEMGDCECVQDHEMTYFNCVEDCTRCNEAADLCGIATETNFLENGRSFGSGVKFDFTKGGDEKSVALYSAHGGEWCELYISDQVEDIWNICDDCEISGVICEDCEVLVCADGTRTYAANCTNYEDGLMINFCDDADDDYGIFAPLAPQDNFQCIVSQSPAIDGNTSLAESTPTTSPTTGKNVVASPTASTAPQSVATPSSAPINEASLTTTPTKTEVSTTSQPSTPLQFEKPSLPSSAAIALHPALWCSCVTFIVATLVTCSP